MFRMRGHHSCPTTLFNDVHAQKSTSRSSAILPVSHILTALLDHVVEIEAGEEKKSQRHHKIVFHSLATD